MSKYKIVIILLIGITVFSACKQQVKIACVGDSITEGAGTEFWNKSSYPVVLDSLMGDNYFVMNCGRGGATMLKKADFTYWKCKELDNVFFCQPDIITIKLGTNDSKDKNWNAINYEKDYQSLIDTFNTIKSNPKIYLCLPVPAFERRYGINDTTILEQVIPIIHKLAEKNNLPVIDTYTGLQGYAGNFSDGIHPDEIGAAKIAEIIASALKE